MKTYLDCLPCFLAQALRACRAATDDEMIHKKVIDRVSEMIPHFSLNISPPEIAQVVYGIVYELTGNYDPFLETKDRANQLALSLYSDLKERVKESDYPLRIACKLAIAGNSIDVGPTGDYGDLHALIESGMAAPLVIDDFEAFRDNIEKAALVLYLGDNAGECLFDRILIEQIKLNRSLEVVYVVREKPIINDATMSDAVTVGLNRLATVISNGSDAPATILSQCSPEVLELFETADLIISKGQGNYESLSDEKGNIFFFLKAKCPIISRILDVKVGDAVLSGVKPPAV